MSTFLLEIGLEEVPAHLVASSENQLIERTRNFLAEHRLTVGAINPYSTPRRLAVELTDVAEKSESLSEEKRGPSIERAKDANGEWTKAAMGFARGQGATPDDFETRDGYVWLTKHTEGVPAKNILVKIGAEVVSEMKFSTYMKWANNAFLYVRPIRWLVALFDKEVVDFHVLDVQTGRVTRGHRFLSNEHVEISSADDYVSKLESASVVVNAEVRKNAIRSQLTAIAKQNNWSLELDTDAAQNLLEEVNNIVEWPTAFAGTFDKKYLEIPDEVLITSMREHQRFFFVTNHDGKLLPHFLSVRNGNKEHLDNVIAGNEKVLVARLEDAEFFYKEDQTKTIADYMEKVKKLVFHEKIGTVYEHMQRTGVLAQALAQSLNFDEQQLSNVSRAAEIYKFDLMTGMVGEFDELQGIMGEHYAKLFGENPAVAAAIKEHYMPTSATGKIAESNIGAVLAVADKLDAIVTFFAADLTPSGSNDPYGLRRAATGIVRTLQEKNWHIALKPVLTQFAQSQGEVAAADITAVLEFILDRVRKLTLDDGVRQDLVSAGVSRSGNTDVVYLIDRINVLAAHSKDNDFRDVIESLTRVDRLAVKQLTNDSVDPSLFENDAEKELYQATYALNLSHLVKEGADEVYTTLAGLQSPISTYFEATMVNTENAAVKNNRYAQLNVIHRLISELGDLEQIVIK
ncbi:glycine--tRNA ligase subunit beta [Leuconostoc mesenteroides]|jgi:glycyl-tRNA synthetase beta chain|uniref:Glycine--tRNA ligase beta subunit n=2 Tax=Bacteria TaxID=2 RepID=A0A843Z2U4_LEUME|nr:glycine--tRNA ligase subunit beta [Leuconostoc mesenteroides]MCI2151682.1 glycine--tRNA ligase subunit beta [Leuconostoc mesenteroides]MCI2167410.1 glycine--tRNA ligase subunit beta [Leuconostoc mesenteroides]MDP0486954.1 glycine--tRNA ligase subunit beta [Leuconostoc mesenteroides]MQR26928.1 glycine--tRNA ligase subunit beta [Leuconostoc mesenteroides]TDV91704.1 glycyl-tRNA synthetase beta chain [Leuconostoc mesenteroides]